MPHAEREVPGGRPTVHQIGTASLQWPACSNYTFVCGATQPYCRPHAPREECLTRSVRSLVGGRLFIRSEQPLCNGLPVPTIRSFAGRRNHTVDLTLRVRNASRGA